MVFSTQHLTEVFSNVDYNDVKTLMFDLANGTLEEGVSAREADEKIRTVVYSILGIDKNSSKRDIHRAMKRHGAELFEVVEDVIDIKLVSGFKDSEFFNEFVDQKNLALGDDNEFWTDQKVLLNVAKVAGDHHDLSIQRLGEGESFRVPTSTYGIKIGADIDLYLMGRIDWTKLTDAIAAAFVRKIQSDIYAEFMNAGTKVPSATQFNKSMAIEAQNKDTFDTLIEDVQTANDGASVVIMGTNAALKKLSKFADISWIADSQKESVANTGRLGTYEGVTLVEIPQRFKENDTATKLVDSKKLFIMPQVDNKFVKLVDKGETEIVEVTEKAARMDDTMTYEVQRSFGVAAIIGVYFGTVTITA